MPSTQVVMWASGRPKTGKKFTRLWAGDTSDYDGDDSRADLAFCSLLVVHTQDPKQIDQIFRKSKLMRDKWDTRHGEGTYGEMTIAKALGGKGAQEKKAGEAEGPQSKPAGGGLTTKTAMAILQESGRFHFALNTFTNTPEINEEPITDAHYLNVSHYLQNTTEQQWKKERVWEACRPWRPRSPITRHRII
jgi:primase-polymerase (primpol)-like protein